MELGAGGGGRGPYGPDQAERTEGVTTDPATLPNDSTWYLVTNLLAQSYQRKSGQY
jgi:hypothetical protein